MEKKALIEAGKEAIRLGVLAAIAFLLAYFSELPQTSVTAVVVLVLRFVDKYIHTSTTINRNGLLPF